MNRTQDRARTPEDTLTATLDTVAARPAPANGGRLTRATAFRQLGPHFDSPALFQVNPGLPEEEAFSLAECLLCHLRSRFSDAVGAGSPISGDEAYASELIIDIVLALYCSVGDHA